MTAAGVVTCTSATNATGTVSYTLNTGSTTLSNCSLSGTKLTVPKDTAKGTYTISITAKSAATTNYKEASKTSTFTLSVLGDTAGDVVGTLTINDSSILSAGEDSRTITWGNIYSTWTHGGGKNYPSGNATLSITCSNSSYKTYVTLDKTSYANSSSTTTTTLTKETCGSTTFSSDVTFVISLKFGSTTIKEISIKGSKNVSTATVASIIAYGVPTMTLSNSITAGASNATVTCKASDLAAIVVEYTSGYNTAASGVVEGSASWAITSQSCVGNATRFSKSGDTLSHGTMSNNIGTDMVALRAANLGDTSKTYSSYIGVSNNRVHTITSISLTYTRASSAANSKNTPTVRYSTSYNYTSGASGSTTSGNTGNITGCTFSKTFTSSSYVAGASLNTSTGVVTWTTANATPSVRGLTVYCTGNVISGGKTTSLETSGNAIQDISTQLFVTVINGRKCPSDVTCEIQSTSGTVGVINSSSTVNGNNMYISSTSTAITFTITIRGNYGRYADVTYQNLSGTSGSPTSRRIYANSMISTGVYVGSGTISVSRSSTSTGAMANITINIS
jgi:hypothetical protein